MPRLGFIDPALADELGARPAVPNARRCRRSGHDGMPDRNKLSALKDQVAVVGVGETDYAADYARPRAADDRRRYGLRGSAPSARALDDSGLTRDDIDGLIAGPDPRL